MKYKLSEIGKVVGGGTPSTKHPEYYTGSGIPWLTPKDLSGYDKMYISKGGRDITQEGLENSSAKLLPANSVLVSSRAPIGYVAIAENEIATNQGFKSIIPNRELVIPEYLYFVMKTSKQDLEQIASGSTFKEVSTKVMSNFEVEIPDLDEQRKVLDYLLPITRKIEKNSRINDNLFAQVRACFENLFENTDETRTFKLSDLIQKTLAGDWGKANVEDRFNSKVSIIRGTDFDSIKNGGIGNAPVRFIKESSEKKKHLKANDILIEISGGSPTQSTGRSLLISNDIIKKFDNTLLGTNFTRCVRPASENDSYLIESYLNFLYQKNVFFNYENGTTGIKNLDYKAVFDINLPDVRLSNKFNAYIFMAKKYYRTIQNNGNENLQLTKLKETLLNKYF